MIEIVCPTVLIHPDAVPPKRGNDYAAGHDIRCVAGLTNLENPVKWDFEQRIAWQRMEHEGGVIIAPGEGFLFRTGFKQAIQPGYACLLWDRSGMGAKKMVGKLAGVIDPDYVGEWFVRLVNFSREAVRVCVGDNIVQGIYQERVKATCPIVDYLPDTDRGSAGFGSTDKPST